MLKQPMCNHSVFRGFLVYLLTYAFLNGLFLLAEPALGGYHADHLIFLLFGAASFGTGFLIDLALLTVVGAISGIIAVNVKK